VYDLVEALQRLSADPLSRTVGCLQLGMLFFEGEELGHEAVELAIGDLGLGYPMIEILVAPELAP